MRESKIGARVLWIGGSPCAGKSTIVDALADRYGLRPYHCDVALESHRQRVSADFQPTMARIHNASWNELWTRSVEDQIADEFAFFHEAFPMMVSDLREIPPTETVIVEASGLLPELVAPVMSDARSAIWLLPVSAFQREHYLRRPWVNDILRQCDDPRQAFENWMLRDSQFADIIEASTVRLNLCSVRVDGSRSLEAMVAIVAEWFRLT